MWALGYNILHKNVHRWIVKFAVKKSLKSKIKEWLNKRKKVHSKH